MSSACSTCLESFTQKSDVSSTPCGHVFHTDCIEKWLKNGQNPCPQCREDCRKDQIIKLFFSEGDSENNLFLEMEEAYQKLQEEKMGFQTENSKLLEDKLRLQNENLKFQEENLRLSKHIKDLKSNSSKVEKSLKLEVEKANKAEQLKQFVYHL